MDQLPESKCVCLFVCAHAYSDGARRNYITASRAWRRLRPIGSRVRVIPWLGCFGGMLTFVWLTGIQLSSLAQSHRHSVWRHVYPLPDQSRLIALLKVDRTASLLCTVILWLPHAILLTAQGDVAQAAVAILSSLLYVLAIRPRRLKRLFSSDADNED